MADQKFDQCATDKVTINKLQQLGSLVTQLGALSEAAKTNVAK
jgi:hypothetical protein